MGKKKATKNHFVAFPILIIQCYEKKFGAENGTRTRHLQLGRLSLYRMSYFRIKKNKWERKDSNLRRLSQQINSLSHLTALELSHIVSRLCL